MREKSCSYHFTHGGSLERIEWSLSGGMLGQES